MMMPASVNVNWMLLTAKDQAAKQICNWAKRLVKYQFELKRFNWVRLIRLRFLIQVKYCS